MKKKVVSIFILCVILLSAIPTSISAALPEQISPLWVNTNVVDAQLVFDGNEGNVAIAISGQTGVNKITAEVKLYFKNFLGIWTEVATDWVYTANYMILSAGETFEGVSGVEYKIELTATVWKNGVGEEITKTASAICP